MKHIAKRAEPQALTDWKALENENWQPTYGTLSGDTKDAVKDALMTEQGYICCYCECRLTAGDSHIEHFRPQSDPAVDALEFFNMFCSCQNQLKKGDPQFCGNLKSDWFEENLLISPLDPDCEDRFTFTGDGGIGSKDENDHAVDETIRRLGLGLPKRNDMRANAIEPFLDETLTDEDMESLVAGYLAVDGQGMFGAFWTTIRYLFGAYAAQ